jgi:hypothetical protein
VSLNHFKSRSALLLNSLQSFNFGLMSLKQGITAHIRECRCEIKHFLFGKEKSVPKFLQSAASILHKQVEVLSLKFVEACQFIFEVVDDAQTAATVRSQECLAISLLNTEAVPKRDYSSSEFVDLALAALLFFHQFIALGHEVGDIIFMQPQLLRGVAITLYDIGICLRLGCPELGPELDHFFAGRLDLGNAAVVLFVDVGEFGIQRRHIHRRKVEARGDRGPWLSGRKLEFDK